MLVLRKSLISKCSYSVTTLINVFARSIFTLIFSLFFKKLLCFQGVLPHMHLALHKMSIWKCVSCTLLIHSCVLAAQTSPQEWLGGHVILRCHNLSAWLSVSGASVSTSHLMCLSITCRQPAVQCAHTQTHLHLPWVNWTWHCLTQSATKGDGD